MHFFTCNTSNSHFCQVNPLYHEGRLPIPTPTFTSSHSGVLSEKSDNPVLKQSSISGNGWLQDSLGCWQGWAAFHSWDQITQRRTSKHQTSVFHLVSFFLSLPTLFPFNSTGTPSSLETQGRDHSAILLPMEMGYLSWEHREVTAWVLLGPASKEY